jgi:hypothetical protein
MANNSYDYLWSSSAKEGLACTMILMDFLHNDVGVSNCNTVFTNSVFKLILVEQNY